jgi:3-polyprenyl-4-hydroxybenzoate decarboxylase
MAELLATAGSVVGFIGLAGQVAQGCTFIWNFVEDVKDAPEDLRRLKEELKLTKDVSSALGILLENSPPDSFTNTKEAAAGALASCAGTIKELTTLLSGFRSKRKHKIKAALNKEKIRKLLSQVHHAMSIVASAQSNMLL